MNADEVNGWSAAICPRLPPKSSSAGASARSSGPYNSAKDPKADWFLVCARERARLNSSLVYCLTLVSVLLDLNLRRYVGLTGLGPPTRTDWPGLNDPVNQNQNQNQAADGAITSVNICAS